MLQAVLLLLKLAFALEKYLRERGLINNAQNDLIAAILVERDADVQRAKAARANANAGGMPDQFQRD